MAKASVPASILPIEEFGKRYDKSKIVPAKIREGIAKLAKANGWCYEEQFITLTGLNRNDLAAFRGPFLEDFCVPVRTETRNETRAWCGTKEMAIKFRKTLGIDV